MHRTEEKLIELGTATAETGGSGPPGLEAIMPFLTIPGVLAEF